MDSFERAFAVLIHNEGGWVNDPHDAGGETKFGISQRSYPHLSISDLTLARAKIIYRRDFWQQMRCDMMPYALALVVFDAGVNSGTRRSILWLQQALRVAQDGIVGGRTLARIKEANVAAIALETLALRMHAMTTYDTWPHHGLGWTRRVIHLAMEASP